jgi:DNA-binding transcriptional LysR family regulator
MELRQLATFLAVAEERSFTRASDRLHVVQSAVSAGVRNLERELDARLFERSTHEVRLTEAGRALLPEARATLQAATAARDAVDGVSGGLRGTVTVGTTQGLRAVSVARTLAEFHAAHPAVEVHLRHAAGGSKEMAREVGEGRIDLAFVVTAATSIPGVELTPLAAEPIVLVTPSAHMLAKRRTVTLARLSAENLAEFPEGWGIRAANDQAFDTAGLTRSIAYEVNDTTILIDLIRNGLAVGAMPASLVEDSDGVACTPIRDHRVEFVTAIATPSNRRSSAAAKALLEAIMVQAAS